MKIGFPPGEFYDCRDAETLAHESPEEAIEEAIEYWMDPDCDVAAVIREHGALTITAYNPQAITEAWVVQLAEGLLDDAVEAFNEEYWSAADDAAPLDRARALPAMVTVVRGLIGDVQAYNCEPVGHVDLTPEQTEEIMRAYRPEWFTAEGEQ